MKYWFHFETKNRGFEVDTWENYKFEMKSNYDTKVSLVWQCHDKTSFFLEKQNFKKNMQNVGAEPGQIGSEIFSCIN